MRWSHVLTVVDVHCGGENARVVTGGVGDVPGETMVDKRAYLTGQPWITQLCQVGADPTDPFPQCYPLADTWGAAPPSPLAARLVAASDEDDLR